MTITSPNQEPMSRKKTLFLAFLVPFTILLLIYAAIGTYPFGNGSLLTIDLGQQYVDFFVYYRQTVLSDPAAIFYSFSKSIGGEMVGLWAYYLTSPFNVIFLLFPSDQIASAVTLLILLKLSLSSLSFSYFMSKKFHQNGLINIIFSISYGLMSYVTVNQFNIMWIDGIIWLPLIILGLDRLIKGKNPIYYVLALAITVFSNYYIAYMICLFLILFYPFLYLSQDNLVEKKNLKHFSLTTLKFAFYSLLAVGLVAFLIVPTAYSLLGGKASYSEMTWNFAYDYDPVLLFSKLYFGSFDFDQMPSGAPNIFVGSIATLSFFGYFLCNKIDWKEKLYAFFMTVFLLVSMNLDSLNKIWHGGQFPIWYPYRFSFVFCFMVIFIGYRWFKQESSYKLSWALMVIGLVTFSSIFFFIYPESYLQGWQLMIGFVITVLALLFLITKKEANKRWHFLLFMLVTLEMTANSAVNIARLSYVRQDAFETYQHMMQSWAQDILPKENQFYRVEKTFQRSKDDAMQVGFYGINHFASTFEKEIPTIFGALGVSEGSGFVSYSNGTLFTDSLFGIRYMIQNNNLIPNSFSKDGSLYGLHEIWTRKDLNYYEFFSSLNQATIFQNNHALSLAFPVDSAINSAELLMNQPLVLQNQLLSYMTANPSQSPAAFSQRNFGIQLDNINPVDFSNANRQKYEKTDASQPATVTLTFTPRSDNPYYLVLDGNIPKDAIAMTLNSEPYQFYKTFRHSAVMNMTSKAGGKPQTLVIELKENSITMNMPQLYELDVATMQEALKYTQTQGLHISKFSQTAIDGKAKIDRDATMLTTIPYSKGWTVEVDGQKVETFKVLDTLLGYSISAGEHTITYRYRTPYLWLGIGISLVSLGILCVLQYYRKMKQKATG